MYPTKAQLDSMSIAEMHAVASQAARSFGANAPGKFADRASALKRTQRYIEEAKARGAQAEAKAAVKAAPVADEPEAPAPKKAKAPAKAKVPAKAAPATERSEDLNLKPRAVEREAPQKGSRRARILAMLERTNGVTLAEIVADTGCTDRQARRDIRRLNSKFGVGIKQDGDRLSTYR